LAGGSVTTLSLWVGGVERERDRQEGVRRVNGRHGSSSARICSGMSPSPKKYNGEIRVLSVVGGLVTPST
jgi:hypothetical protein